MVASVKELCAREGGRQAGKVALLPSGDVRLPRRARRSQQLDGRILRAGRGLAEGHHADRSAGGSQTECGAGGTCSSNGVLALFSQSTQFYIRPALSEPGSASAQGRAAPCPRRLAHSACLHCPHVCICLGRLPVRLRCPGQTWSTGVGLTGGPLPPPPKPHAAAHPAGSSRACSRNLGRPVPDRASGSLPVVSSHRLGTARRLAAAHRCPLPPPPPPAACRLPHAPLLPSRTSPRHPPA